MKRDRHKRRNSISVVWDIYLLQNKKKGTDFSADTHHISSWKRSRTINSSVDLVKILTENNMEEEYSIMVFLVFIISAALLKAYNLKYTTTLSANIGTDLSSLCYGKIIRRELIEQLDKNSAYTINGLTRNTKLAVQAVNLGLHIMPLQLRFLY